MDKCNLCKESGLGIGEKSSYGSMIIYKKDGWFATLSPRTGGNPEKDFSIQLMPVKHLRYFSDLHSDEDLAKGYGIAFAKLSKAISEEIGSESNKIPIGTYGKCKHEDEHIHMKLFPYRGDIGQPFTVDSSFGKKEIHNDGEEFVKMKPVNKSHLGRDRFNKLSKKFIEILNG